MRGIIYILHISKILTLSSNNIWLEKKKEDLKPVTTGSGKKGFKHLKWPAIILIIFIILLTIYLDHLSRTGKI